MLNTNTSVTSLSSIIDESQLNMNNLLNQDPVKQMFTAITKALRAQSIGIRDLCRKCDENVSKRSLDLLLIDISSTYCKKEEIAGFLEQLNEKPNQQQVTNEIDQVKIMIRCLQEEIREQGVKLSDLNSKNEVLENTLMATKEISKRTIETLQSHYQQQMESLSTELDKKISSMSDDSKLLLSRNISSVEKAANNSSSRLVDEVKKLQRQQEDLALLMTKAATRDELKLLTVSKADAKDLRLLSSQVSDAVNRNDLHQQITSQLKPLVVAMASLEKTMQIQETIYSSHFSQLQTLNDEFNKFASSQSLLAKSNFLSQQLLNSDHSHGSSSTSNSNALSCLTILQQQQITNLVEKTFDELMERRHHGVVTDDALRTALVRHSKDLRENVVNAINDLRMELELNNGEKVRDATRLQMDKVEQVISTLQTTVKKINSQTSDLEAACVSSVRALSDKVIAALGRKVDVIEFKAVCDDIHKANKSLKEQCTHDIESIKTDQEKLANKYEAISTARHHDNNINKSQIEKLESQLIRHQQLLDSKFDRQMLNQISRDVSSHLEINQISLTDDTMMTAKSSSGNSNNSGGGNLIGNNIDVLKNEIAKINIRYQTQVDRMSSVDARLQGLSQWKEAVEHIININHLGSSEIFSGNDYDTKATTLTETRVALTQAILALQKDISLKPSKQDVFFVVTEELSKRLGTNRSISHHPGSDIYKMDSVSLVNSVYEQQLAEVSRDLTNLKLQVASEIIGSRWLWTSGRLSSQNFILWDREVPTSSAAATAGAAVGGATGSLFWRGPKPTDAAVIHTRLAGLYRVCVAIFSDHTRQDRNEMGESSLQIYLNGECILMKQPLAGLWTLDNDPSRMDRDLSLASLTSCVTQRPRHTAGEITCVCIEEYVSLPPDAELSVQLKLKNSSSQGFFSFKKI